MTQSTPSPSGLAESISPHNRLVIIIWLVVVVSVTLFRMYLVGQDEIVVLRFDPTVYAETSVYYFEDSPFSIIPTHRNGLPLLGWAARQFGIPYKLLLDGLLTLTAIFSGICMAQLIGSHATGMLLFASIMFSPWFTGHSRIFMSEPLVAVVFPLQLILAVQFICRPVKSWSVTLAVLASVVASVYALSRNETMLLVMFWGMVIGCVAIRQKLFRVQAIRQSGWRLLLLLLPLFSAWTAMEAVKRVNLARYGVYSLCVTETDGIVSLLNALYSIPPDQEIRYSPVTRDSLSRACDISPTLATYREKLLDTNRTAYVFGQAILELDQQVGTWLNWHLVDCIGGGTELPDQEMARAAEEIRRAQADGRIAWRWAKYPVDPAWRSWLPELPLQMGLALKRTLNRQLSRLDGYFVTHRLHDSVREGYYDDGLLRRSSIMLDRTTRIFGKSHQLDTRAKAVRLLGINGQHMLTVPVLTHFDGEKYFSMSIRDIENPNVDSILFVQLLDHENPTSVTQPIQLARDLRLMSLQFDFSGNDDSQTSETWDISASRNTPANGTRQRLQRFFGRDHGYLIITTFLFALAAGFRNKNGDAVLRDIFWFAAIGLGFLLARCLFYSLIEVWMMWGLSRYVEPNIFLALLVICSLAYVTGVLLNRLYRRIRNA